VRDIGSKKWTEGDSRHSASESGSVLFQIHRALVLELEWDSLRRFHCDIAQFG
jgi:hypothetical protein